MHSSTWVGFVMNVQRRSPVLSTMKVARYLIRVSPNEAAEDRRRIEYGQLEKKINEMFPNSSVYLVPVADKLIVKGQARDAAEATQIMAVLRGQATDQSVSAVKSHAAPPSSPSAWIR